MLTARGVEVPPLVYVNPDDTVREAITRMHRHGVSQLPVCKNEPPFSAAEVAGAVDELELMDAAFRDPGVMEMPVEKVMGPKLPTIGAGQPLSLAVEMLDRAPALLVLAGGRPLSVLTRSDVLAFLSAGGVDMADQDEAQQATSASRPAPSTPARSRTRPAVPSSSRSPSRRRSPRRPSASTAGFEYARTRQPDPCRAGDRACASLEGARHGFAFASGLAAEDAVLRLVGARASGSCSATTPTAARSG